MAASLNRVAEYLERRLPGCVRLEEGRRVFHFEPSTDVPHNYRGAFEGYFEDEDVPKYDGELAGLEELLPRPGTEIDLGEESDLNAVCPNCYNALPGTCSFCAPRRGEERVRQLANYTVLMKRFLKTGKVPEEFIVA